MKPTSCPEQIKNHHMVCGKGVSGALGKKRPLEWVWGLVGETQGTIPAPAPRSHGSVLFSRFWCKEEGKDKAAVWWPLSTLPLPPASGVGSSGSPSPSATPALHFTTCPVVLNHHGPLIGLCTAPDWRTCMCMCPDLHACQFQLKHSLSERVRLTW